MTTTTITWAAFWPSFWSRKGNRVTFVTPATKVSDWSAMTLDQPFIQARLLELGVDVHVTRGLAASARRSVTAACTYTGRETEIACDAVLLVTARLPNDGLYRDLKAAGSLVVGSWH